MLNLIACSAFIAQKHDGQRRRYTDEPYIMHPFRVAYTLANIGYDEPTVLAGLLHDTLEDTDTQPKEILDRWGDLVLCLVQQVTNPSRPADGNRAARKAIDLKHLQGCSPTAASIKLADIIDNVPAIIQYDPNFAKVYVPEKLAQLELLRHGNALLFRRAEEALSWMSTAPV